MNMKKCITSLLFITLALPLSSPAMAADACEMVLCLYGKTTGNGGGNECRPAEQSFFNIVRKNKYGFLPDHTADARESFLHQCTSADPAIIDKIISQFGRVRH